MAPEGPTLRARRRNDAINKGFMLTGGVGRTDTPISCVKLHILIATNCIYPARFFLSFNIPSVQGDNPPTDTREIAARFSTPRRTQLYLANTRL